MAVSVSGSGTISSPGIGSNLNVNSIITQLMAIEQQPLTALAQKEAAYQTQISAYGSLKGALSSFQAAAHAASDLTKFQALTATSADPTIYTAAAAGTAVPGSYSIQVTQLAQSHKLISQALASTTTTVGTGTLTFQYGTFSGGVFTLNPAKAAQTVTIGSGNNTLSGIRDAINAAGIGVSASILNDGTGNRLVFTSKDSGAANSLKITVTGDGDGNNVDNAGLSQLAYDPAGTLGNGKNLTETVAAQDALLNVDGVTGIRKASNTVTDAIQGVTLNLLAPSVPGKATTLTVSNNQSSVQTSVTAFVSAFNDLAKTVSSLTAYDAGTKQAAVLQGDLSAESIQTQIRRTLTTAVSYTGGGITTLSQIGVAFQSDGTLAVNSTTLQAALTSNFKDVAGLFAALGKPTDSLIAYAGSTANTTPGSYAVSVSQLATHGTSVGTSAAGLTITAGVNDALQVTVDGVSATVTLAAGTYASAGALAAEVQAEINGATALSSSGTSLTVTQTGGVLTLASNRYGSASTVTVTGGNGKANLLGATTTDTAGVDTAGTINGIAATGSGQFLTGATGNAAEGLKIQITGGSTGSRGTISYSQGYAFQLDKLAGSLLGNSGPIVSRTNGINASIKDIGSRRDALNSRLAATESRLRAQFTALDTLLGQLQTTSNFLTTQLGQLASTFQLAQISSSKG